jgi:hypothetical protein
VDFCHLNKYWWQDAECGNEALGSLKHCNFFRSWSSTGFSRILLHVAAYVKWRQKSATHLFSVSWAIIILHKQHSHMNHLKPRWTSAFCVLSCPLKTYRRMLHGIHCIMWEPGECNSREEAMSSTAKDLLSDSCQAHKSYLIPKACRLAVQPMQAPTQCTPGLFPWGMRVTSHIHLRNEVKNQCSCTSGPTYIFMIHTWDDFTFTHHVNTLTFIILCGHMLVSKMYWWMA